MNDKCLPKQGIFWVIDGTVVSLDDTVDPENFVEFGSMNHRDQWRFIQANFPVNGDLVEYDYFPRGRVIVCPTFDDENRIIGYECNVYADSCIIDDPIVRMEIEDAFDLDLLDMNSCTVNYCGDYSTDNTHYTCHKCREGLNPPIFSELNVKMSVEYELNPESAGLSLKELLEDDQTLADWNSLEVTVKANVLFHDDWQLRKMSIGSYLSDDCQIPTAKHYWIDILDENKEPLGTIEVKLYFGCYRVHGNSSNEEMARYFGEPQDWFSEKHYINVDELYAARYTKYFLNGRRLGYKEDACWALLKTMLQEVSKIKNPNNDK